MCPIPPQDVARGASSRAMAAAARLLALGVEIVMQRCHVHVIKHLHDLQLAVLETLVLKDFLDRHLLRTNRFTVWPTPPSAGAQHACSRRLANVHQQVDVTLPLPLTDAW